MKCRFLLVAAMFLFASATQAQNFSGLLNKRLNKVDDVGTLLESGIGSLFGGKLSGGIDSVVITNDSEKELRARIYYNGYTAGFFTVSVMDAAKKKQNEVVVGKFSQAAKASPVEVVLPMAATVAKGAAFESPYLRIDVAKKENGTGNITVFGLNKKWRNQLDPQNVIVNVTLRPVGIAANLKSNEVKDVVPGKTIRFDPKLLYVQPTTIKRVQTIRPIGGGNRLISPVHYENLGNPDDISGTWTNTDGNTNGITKLIITGNNSIQAFGKCSPTDCDWGKTPLTALSATAFKAVFTWSFQTTTLSINLAGGQLSVNSVTVRNGAVSNTGNYTFQKNGQLVVAPLKVYNLSQVAIMKPAVMGIATQNKTPQGPDKNIQINLWDGLTVDNQVDFKRPQDISNINMNIFADKNIYSGIYYILPADYHLRWETKTEPEKGYAFNVLYGSQQVENSNAPVRMSATLTAGISSRERNFIKTLLRAARPDFVDLRFLPLRENPQFTFQSTLTSQYNIPQDKIAVETTTDLNNDIRVSWQTDADTKEFIQTALTSHEGIAASVILKPDDEGILDQQIPASINLADTRTLGKMSIEPNDWRTHNWRNLTPYPLKLNYLHVLKKEEGTSKPIIYSWSLGDAVIPSQGQAAFNSGIVPAWLDNAESVVMWLDYSVQDCSDCDAKVMDAVTGGVSGSKAQQIKFVIPPAVFDTLHASYFMITVRSAQVDPKGTEVKELAAIKVTREGEFSTGPLFIPQNGTLDFEYKITAATDDGDFYPSNGWIRASEKEMLLGKTKMKDIFRGIIPGIQ